MNEVDDVARRAARADDEVAVVLLGDLGAEAHDMAAQVLPLARVGDERTHAFDVEVLGEVVVRAVAHRLDGGVEILVGGDDDDLDVRVVLLDDLQDLEAADARQADIEHHQVDVLFFHDLQRGLAGGGFQNAEVAPEKRQQRFAHPFVIINDEDGLAALWHRRREYSAAP